MDSTASEFTVAACNVLAEQPYRKWSRTTLIAAEHRQAVLAKAFSDPTAFGNADIICLTEWDQFHLEETLKKQGWEWVNPRTPAARWGTTIAFKKAMFDLEASDVGSVDGRYEHAAARLRVKSSGAAVGVASCHLPFSGPTAALAAIMQRVHSVLSVPSAIVCGDFNSTDAAAFKRVVPAFTSVFPPEWPTSRNPTDHFISIDYVWTRGLDVIASHIEPNLMKPNGMRLVAHAAGATQTGDFFSDHCVLNARFRFSSAAQP